MTAVEIIEELRQLSDPAKLMDLDRYAIKTPKAFGIRAPELKAFAREVKKLVADRHAAAQELWQSGIYDARAVAFLIDDPKKVTSAQMDAWATDFDNWATVDGACSYLFCRTPFAYEKAYEWAGREREFEKRAAFSLMAYLAVHDKKAPNESLVAFLPVIEAHADDDRNFVKKAINWALRQIGKRNLALNSLAIETAERIKLQNTKPARWIAADVLRELRSPQVLARLLEKEEKRPQRGRG
ncbi:MAG TPA: DNA alkylation repair protein [Pyrinomonadaceae bacterium]|jgi:3-methyladenine DNA glycosylase AlkD|nr:DNA alkylation repair protein [Pyrinomonadaceae bacterium]